MDYLDSFGEWLRQRREAQRLTRAELAACAGCSVSALRKIETDERRPSRQLAALIAQCLRIPAEEQLLFLDAARGARPVARLGWPSPQPLTRPLPSPASSRELPSGPVPGPPLWNLPTPAVPLVGRKAELAMLAQLLGDPGCRLITLVGPGGIGKTRLAIEAACLALERFANGVFFVSLADTSSHEFMVPAIAQAVGFNFFGPAEPRSQLASYLRDKRILLVLDNVEHLLQGVDVLVELLATAPQMKMLVTSRERLELNGEWVFEVQGLPVPAAGQVKELEKISAVMLFMQRARQARVDYEFSHEDGNDIVRFCRLVEGTPLAIELAATWIPALSLSEIADEIERGLDILTTRHRDIPERQRSMQAVFAHSWQLLNVEEQQALARLSVLQGGFQREAAEAIAGAGLPLLSALVAKSFLRRTAASRYSLHELVRQYVAERLAETPEKEVQARDRHGAYYMDFVAGLEDDMKGAKQLQALAALDAEVDNIRAGWRWVVQRGELSAFSRTVRALWYFFDLRGYFEEAAASFGWAADELERGVIARMKPEPSVQTLSALARAHQGWFYLRRGNLVEAQTLLEASLASLQVAGPMIELADVFYFAGTIAWLTGNYERARRYYLAELALAEQVGKGWDVALATGNLGLLAQTVGEYAEAERRWQKALAINRRLGDQRMVAAALHFYGILKRILGAHVEARAYFQESMALSAATGERWIYGMALGQLGEVTRALGDDAEAVRLLRESVTLLRDLGEHWSTLHALIGFGSAALATGDYTGSGAAYAEALRIAWERQALPEVLESLSGVCTWWARKGAPEQTLTIVHFILNHPAATEQTKEAARRLRPELEAQLGPEQNEGAKGSAETLSLGTLVTSLLEQTIL